jgi:hypothetical protein
LCGFFPTNFWALPLPLLFVLSLCRWSLARTSPIDRFETSSFRIEIVMIAHFLRAERFLNDQFLPAIAL